MPGPDDTPIPDVDLGPNPPRDNSRRIFTAIAIFLALMAAILVAKTQGVCGFTNCRSIEALEVSASSGMAKGGFRMVETMFHGIETDDYGGACLLFKDPRGTGCVHNPGECSVPANLTALNVGASAYCAPEKSCWIKVREKHCWKSLAQTPPVKLVAGNVRYTPDATLSEVRQDLFPTGNAPTKIQARVLACLNGKFTAPAGPPCGTGIGDRDEKFGKTSLLNL